MQVRLTQIALRHNGHRYLVGAVVTEDQLPAELLAARVAAGTAEMVLEDGDVRPEVHAALADFLTRMQDTATAMAAVLALLDQASPAELKAVGEALQAGGDLLNGLDGVERLREVEEEMHAASAAEASAAWLARDKNSEGGEKATASISAMTEAGHSLSSDDTAGASGPAVSDDPSGAEKQSSRDAHNVEIAGASPAPAPNDNPAQKGGVDGDPAAVKAAAGKPAPAAVSSTRKKANPAPKGGAAGSAKKAAKAKADPS